MCGVVPTENYCSVHQVSFLCVASYGSIASSVEYFLTPLSLLTCQGGLQAILLSADLLGNSLKPSSGPFPQFFQRRNRTISPVSYLATAPLKCKSVERNFAKNSLCIVCDCLRKQIHTSECHIPDSPGLPLCSFSSK